MERVMPRCLDVLRLHCTASYRIIVMNLNILATWGESGMKPGGNDEGACGESGTNPAGNPYMINTPHQHICSFSLQIAVPLDAA